MTPNQLQTSLYETQNQLHIQNNPSKPYDCGICGRAFSSESNLKRHVKDKHLNPGGYQCPRCSRRMTDASNFKRHLLCVHGSSVEEYNDYMTKRVAKFANQYAGN